MVTLGLDLTDDSLRGTPNRVAKMYIEEIFSGLNPANKPSVSLFENYFNRVCLIHLIYYLCTPILYHEKRNTSRRLPISSV